MSTSYSYPGVYIQELQSPVHAISAVATSITAFVGYTPKGIDNRAEAIYSFSDFERLFGGLALDSEVGYAVQQFYQNNGAQAYVVRIPKHQAKGSSVTFDGITFTALSSGTWSNRNVLIDVDVVGVDLVGDPKAFNLTITDLADDVTESFPNVTLDNTKKNYVVAVVNDPDEGSQIVNVAIPAAPAAAVTITGVMEKRSPMRR